MDLGLIRCSNLFPSKLFMVIVFYQSNGIQKKTPRPVRFLLSSLDLALKPLCIFLVFSWMEALPGGLRDLPDTLYAREVELVFIKALLLVISPAAGSVGLSPGPMELMSNESNQQEAFAHLLSSTMGSCYLILNLSVALRGKTSAGTWKMAHLVVDKHAPF